MSENQFYYVHIVTVQTRAQSECVAYKIVNLQLLVMPEAVAGDSRPQKIIVLRCSKFLGHARQT